MRECWTKGSATRGRGPNPVLTINGKFSLASGGFRSAFPVIILKSKAEQSGEGYWQAVLRAEQQPPTERAEAEEAGCET